MNRLVRMSRSALPLSLVVCLALGGCGRVANWTKTDRHRLLSPDKLIEPPERSPINPILDNISLADQTQELVPNATFPREGDWEYVEKDYVIGPTDVVNVSILDLFQEGMETVLQREVSDTGFIDLPLIERVKAEGLTKDELTEAIKQSYSPNIIRNPTVSVTIVARRQSTYYILGAIARPSQYMIARRDMRLLEAMAIAGGVVQNNIEYLYVIRPAPAIRKASEQVVETAPGGLPAPLPSLPEVLPEALPPTLPEAPPAPAPETAIEKPEVTPPAIEQPALPPAIIQPMLTPAPQPSEKALKKAEAAVEANDIEAALRELGQAMPPGKPATQPEETPSPAEIPHFAELAEIVSGGAGGESSDTKWAFRNGKWVRVPKEEAAATTPAEPVAPVAAPPQPVMPEVTKTPPAAPEAAAPTATPPAAAPVLAPPSTAQKPKDEEDPFGWRRASKSDMARVIAISVARLNNGDATQNVVIRDNDVIYVPYLPVGEFYVTGEVLRPGVYSLPSTPVTIKQALAAAGNVGPLAWPENSILIRRIGDHQEQVIPVNVEAIFKGDEPDVFLKPNDIIAVGTDVRASFYAVLRNAFRMTYGFGFIYDRNFSDPLFVTPKSNRFTRL